MKTCCVATTQSYQGRAKRKLIQEDGWHGRSDVAVCDVIEETLEKFETIFSRTQILDGTHQLRQIREKCLTEQGFG